MARKKTSRATILKKKNRKTKKEEENGKKRSNQLAVSLFVNCPEVANVTSW